MKKYALIFAGLCAAMSGLNTAQAAIAAIQCPVNQVRAEIITPLPNGWWQTPQVGSLRGTRVAKLGGHDTLFCEYGAYGTKVSIMMRAPFGTCTANRGGFTCSSPPPQAPRPVTHKTGGINLKQTWAVDLDNGHVGSSGGSDIWFQARTATDRYITPRNGATIGIAGRRSVGKEGCMNVRKGRQPIHINRMPVGTYVCVRTNEGRMSQFRVNRQAGPSPGTLGLGYTTWKH